MPKLTPELLRLKALHAPRLDREHFDAEVAKLWPEASRKKLSALNRDAMYEAHLALGLSPAALCAGFADALKSPAKR